MRTIADTVVGSAVGLMVVAAMFVAIWVARDSSGRVGVAEADQEASPLQSARTHRAPVTRTSISPQRVRALQEK